MKLKYILIFLTIAFIVNTVLCFFVLPGIMPDYYRADYDFPEDDIRKSISGIFFPVKEAKLYEASDVSLVQPIGILTEPVTFSGDRHQVNDVLMRIVLDEKHDAYVSRSDLRYLPSGDKTSSQSIDLVLKNRLPDGKYYSEEARWSARSIEEGISRVTVVYDDFTDYTYKFIYDTDGEKIWSVKKRGPWSFIEYIWFLYLIITNGGIVVLAGVAIHSRKKFK
ncbi:hypothetical protein ACFL1E_00895 [Candidatus Omnitrophota bacterium]